MAAAPRTRGDGPVIDYGHEAHRNCFLRSRGWAPAPLRTVLHHALLPAPCVCGDGPAALGRARRRWLFSVHAVLPMMQ